MLFVASLTRDEIGVAALRRCDPSIVQGADSSCGKGGKGGRIGGQLSGMSPLCTNKDGVNAQRPMPP